MLESWRKMERGGKNTRSGHIQGGCHALDSMKETKAKETEFVLILIRKYLQKSSQVMVSSLSSWFPKCFAMNAPASTGPEIKQYTLLTMVMIS